jgi:hypothetical protein
MPDWAIVSFVNRRTAPTVSLFPLKSNRVATVWIEPIDPPRARLAGMGDLACANAQADKPPYRREYVMKSVTQAISGKAVTKAANASPIRRDGPFCCPSPMPQGIADQGKIRLGGAWRLPASHKAG